MLCSSPMSTSICLKKDIEDPSEAGIKRPLMAMRVKSPQVFRLTVLPPVFGPVMTRVLNVLPSSKSMGTTRSRAIRGWRAFFKRITPCSFNRGRLASWSKANLALAMRWSSSANISVSSMRASA